MTCRLHRNHSLRAATPRANVAEVDPSTSGGKAGSNVPAAMDPASNSSLHTSSGFAGEPGTPMVDEIPRAAALSSGKDEVIDLRRHSSPETPAATD